MSINLLYKYRRLDKNGHTRQIVVDSTLYFSAPSQFNEPFDCRIPIFYQGSKEQMREFLNERLADHGFGPFDFTNVDEPALAKAFACLVRSTDPELPISEIEERAQAAVRNKVWDDLSGYHDEQMIERRNQQVRVYCLSERNDDILMWAHYADKHGGVCLQFQVVQNTLFSDARSVEYTKKYPVINRFASTKEEQFQACLLTKSCHWAHEKERRIIRLDNNHHVKFPEHLLSGIILGCRMTEGDKQKVLKWLESKKQEVQLYQAIEKKREFGLDINLVT